MPRADLRVHSRHSDRPTNFFLKRMKAPESLTEPEAAYALAKRRGMDFVTLTDTDTIAGCLEIAKHPDVFTSCETTVAFPKDDCKVRLLVLGINETQLQRMLEFRGHIYQVRDYLCAENIFHAVASPFDILNSRLNADHIEKLLLLFDHFETRSGARHERTCRFLTAILDRLTPEFMDALRRKWSIEPASEKPWQKGYIGGADDYCGQYVGLTWTEVPQARTPSEYLDALKRRSGIPGGAYGSTLTTAHSMYRIAFQYYQRYLSGRAIPEPDIVTLVLSRVLQPDAPRRLTVGQAFAVVVGVLERFLRLRRRPTLLERRLVREFILAYREIPSGERLADIPPDDLTAFDERLCALVDRVVSRVSYRLFMQASREFTRGRVGNAIMLGSAVLPLQGVMGPYIYAFDQLNRDRPLIAQVETRFNPALDLPPSRPKGAKKIAWFSDTVSDVNGVSLTLNKMAGVAEEEHADLTIITSALPDKAPRGSKFLNFEPVGEIPVPDYELQKLSMPPALRMIRYLETAGFTEYVVSTPAAVGLVAMLAARLFHVPCRAIYHSDFPQHVRQITGDEALEESTWTYMRWFYGRADVVYSPSEYYRRQLIEHGFDPSRLFLFHRGTDLDVFSPRHRDERYYETWGIRNRVMFAYVGRVSREKNLDLILDAFVSDEELKEKAALAIIGDGPYLSELRARYTHPAVVFCGFAKGKALATAYASADVFLFPSTTDTYGNSVLEAQASGLPAVVSDEGGPKEIIVAGESGIVLPGHDVSAWRATMRDLAASRERRLRMGSAARAHTAARDWTTAFREFWNHDPYAGLPPRRRASRLVPFPVSAPPASEN